MLEQLVSSRQHHPTYDRLNYQIPDIGVADVEFKWPLHGMAQGGQDGAQLGKDTSSSFPSAEVNSLRPFEGPDSELLCGKFSCCLEDERTPVTSCCQFWGHSPSSPANGSVILNRK